MPDFAPVTKGHALIISKSHILSFSHLDKERLIEFCDLIDLITGKIYDSKHLYVECFEHGSTLSLENNMSSITHAHLHLIPCKTQSEIYEIGYNFELFDTNELIDNNVFKEKGYLSFLSNDKKLYISVNEKFVSQFFRKFYADKFHQNEYGDWKLKRNSDLVLETLEFYSDIFN